MTAFIDTSVLVAAIVASEDCHAQCERLLDQKGIGMYAHGLAETFSTLTGGRKGFQMRPSVATAVLEEDYVPCITFASLTPSETLRALRDAEGRGVRGGAVFDYLHLVAARKMKAARLYTLNISNFRSCHRAGDPEIVHP